MRNTAASIKARLLNHARTNGHPLNPLLENYAMGRLFWRLSESPYSNDFILKGAQVFAIWANAPHRPTRDADFLCFRPNDIAGLERIFREICDIPSIPEDGLEWDEISANAIREDNVHGGIRVRITALLGKARIPVQVDVGFGDSIVPGPQESYWIGLLDFPSARLLVYPPETVVAEKLEAAVALGYANSRMKDFYDLYWLSRNVEFDASVLRQAIEATFKQRNTAIPSEPPPALTAQFSSRSEKKVQWTGFIRQSYLDPLDFDEVVAELDRFLVPVIVKGNEGRIWKPNEGWKLKSKRAKGP